MQERASQGTSDRVHDRPAPGQMTLALFELHEDLIGPAGAELVGPAGNDVHVQHGDGDAELVPRPADRTGDETARADDHGVLTLPDHLHGDLAALLKGHGESQEFHRVCIEAACRQRRAGESSLLEYPLVHGPRAMEEVNLRVRPLGPNLLGDRQQRVNVPARAAAREEKRNVAHIGLLACPLCPRS